MSQILEVLFGSRSRARLIRFFLHNPEKKHVLAEIASKNLLEKRQVLQELRNLQKIKLVAKKTKGNRNFYFLNKDFPFYPELRDLIVKSNIHPPCRGLDKIKKIGNVKLALVSGVFLNYPKSRADILIVANNVSRVKIKKVVKNLEAEVGREICYVLMNNEEFKYRLNMLDRFILDFLEGPHGEVVNKIPQLRRLVAGFKK